MVKLLVCDFDDTLVDELKFVESGFYECARVFAPQFPNLGTSGLLNLFRSEFSVSSSGVFDRVFGKIGGNNAAKLAADAVDAYRYHSPNIAYNEDVKPFLVEAERRGLHTAIVTDGNAKTQRNKLEAVGAFADFEKTVITAEHGESWSKPSPLPFEYLKNFFEIDYSEMLYIGDNPKKDFAMKKYIPIKTARIIRTNGIYKNKPYLWEIREDAAISALPEIFKTDLF